LETQNIANNQGKGNTEQKEQCCSYHKTLTSNYTTKPVQQHGTGTKTDMKTSGTKK
jgi:hypothetical protein